MSSDFKDVEWGKPPETVKKDRNSLHPVDEAIFKEHPSPLWEAWMRIHPTHINHTTPHFGPMLYHIIRAMGCPYAIEIGVAQGYTSFFMASAIRDNNVRYGCNGRYVAIDVMDKHYIFDPLIKEGFPIDVWTTNSLDVKKEQLASFPGGIDLIFQDGWHNTKHCLKELELFYPYLKGDGNGYWIMHDVYSYCEEYYNIVMKDPRYKFESVRFLNNYGLAICRKMEGYDYNKKFWPQGDQPEEQGFVA